ncbi:ankyrin repeat domain-containing protein [Elizabethkingia anophelis]|uniref:ankyrin repeat domain-containing protein n=1 Tax=Elizabethkingia anophelis TaxID=1117645 RepID=UPI001369C9C8|nr:ankyrin repeat domain-containing protein [Elizabethkingia anophelis]MYY27403.1 ankyrin repeat domain-containing protein [Elizabethkingia anophelis]
MKYFIFAVILFFAIGRMSAQDIFSYAKIGNAEALSQFKKDIDSINTESYTPLILAVYHNHYKAAQWPLENGANPDLQDIKK